jgi:hypothetical protein
MPTTLAPAAPSPEPSHPHPAYPAPPLRALRCDARLRLSTTEGVPAGQSADEPTRGLFGEALEPGLLSLWRCDLRLPLSPVRGVEVIPWLRLGNESEAILTEGAEQLSSVHGSLTLRAQKGPFSAAAGAFPLHLSPLLLQRWDSEDAPPLGGVNSCGCGASTSGLSQRSLEVLGPDYTFEGATARVTRRLARGSAWLAVPRWEKSVSAGALPSEQREARFRRILRGGSLALGPSGAGSPLDMPSPWGLRLGYLRVGDDTRSLPRDNTTYWPRKWDEEEFSLEGKAGPWRGLSLEGEQAWSWIAQVTYQQARSGSEREAERSQAHRYGASGFFPRGRWTLWGRLHHLRVEPGYQPLYRALTYDPNRIGWRAAAGVRLFDLPGEKNERWGLSGFYRGLREIETAAFPPGTHLGAERYRVASLTLLHRPFRGLALEAHYVRTETLYPFYPDPLPQKKTASNQGWSLDVRAERWPSLDPSFRLDVVRPGQTDDTPGAEKPRTAVTAALWLRVLL